MTRQERFRHLSATFRRQLRGRRTDTIAIVVLLILGLATTLVIISQQKSAIPGWVPVLGKDFFHLDAEFQTGQSITPGQGQSVMINGIRIGKISSVELNDGTADVGLDIETEYAKLIHPDASLLLRPKTNLNDMTIEVDMGSEEGQIEENSNIPLARTLPNVSPDESLAALDGDTRTYIQLLLQGAGAGLEDRGGQLSSVWRRLYPFTRDLARVNGALAERRAALASVVHNFRLLAEEMAEREEEVTRFVSGSSGALRAFANQANSIRGTLRALPATLDTTEAALRSANSLSLQVRPALTKLTPQAHAFAPALRATQRFFRQSLPILSDQVTPFTRQVRPTVKTLAQAAKPVRNTVRGFRDTIKPLNYGLNQLAYNPPGGAEGYLFYLPWLNHNMNATYLQDAGGPIRRGIVLLTCNTIDLATAYASAHPSFPTLLDVTRVPTKEELC